VAYLPAAARAAALGTISTKSKVRLAACIRQSRTLYAGVDDDAAGSARSGWFRHRDARLKARRFGARELMHLNGPRQLTVRRRACCRAARSMLLGRSVRRAALDPPPAQPGRRRSTRFLRRIHSSAETPREFSAFRTAPARRGRRLQWTVFPGVARYVAPSATGAITHEVGLQPERALHGGEATAYPIHIPEDEPQAQNARRMPTRRRAAGFHGWYPPLPTMRLMPAF
jgi:hypothetical protein